MLMIKCWHYRIMYLIFFFGYTLLYLVLLFVFGYSVICSGLLAMSLLNWIECEMSLPPGHARKLGLGYPRWQGRSLSITKQLSPLPAWHCLATLWCDHDSATPHGHPKTPHSGPIPFPISYRYLILTILDTPPITQNLTNRNATKFSPLFYSRS